MKTTTVRELLRVSVQHISQQEQLCRSGAIEAAGYILDNSSLTVALDDSIDLRSGNIWGIVQG